MTIKPCLLNIAIFFFFFRSNAHSSSRWFKDYSNIIPPARSPAVRNSALIEVTAVKYYVPQSTRVESDVSLLNRILQAKCFHRA